MSMPVTFLCSRLMAFIRRSPAVTSVSPYLLTSDRSSVTNAVMRHIMGSH